MAPLTSRQRDLLQILLEADQPLPSAALARKMQLTPRQVNYGLKGLNKWLAQRDVVMNVTPGVGVQVTCSAEQSDRLKDDLAAAPRLQLVLNQFQRQQLLALLLLNADEPFILYQLQRVAEVSRTTVLKDLDGLEPWLTTHGLALVRRPNYGIEVAGDERRRREALAALLWGNAPLGQPLLSVSHQADLVFALDADASISPLVAHVKEHLSQMGTRRALSHIAFAEAQLGGRFTDDAVRYLALVLAIQDQRIEWGRRLPADKATVTAVQALPAWSVAEHLASRLAGRDERAWPPAELAALAVTLLSAPRNERWPGDLALDRSFSDLVDAVMDHISAAYELPSLAEDRTLRDGLVTHIIPACLRRRFDVWLPDGLAADTLPAHYTFEHTLARQVAGMVAAHTGAALAESDANSIALLLRAAYIRERPHKVEDVLVVCPSGMATAQLLVARLKARFPRLGTVTVVSMRRLNAAAAAAAGLIITTAPLPEDIVARTAVIQVHPLLLPEDVETITRWLA